MYRIHSHWDANQERHVHTLYSPEYLEVKRTFSATGIAPQWLRDLQAMINKQWFASVKQRHQVA